MTDPRDGRRVALKKLPNVFQSLVSSKRVFRELKMLCFFKHENVSWKSLAPLSFLRSTSIRSNLKSFFIFITHAINSSLSFFVLITSVGSGRLNEKLVFVLPIGVRSRPFHLASLSIECIQRTIIRFAAESICVCNSLYTAHSTYGRW